LFFSILSSVLTTVSSTAILTKDRHEAVSRVKNGFYSPGVYLAAQFLASSVYALAISSVFMSIFHWLVNINPTAECFFYGIILNWWVVNLMEGYLNFIIEVFKNDFLCTTSGMVFIGVMMSFCGFFRAVSEMPVWISWMSYVLPLRYAFDGYVTQLFQSQLWTVSGTSMTLTGNEVLSLMFHLQDVNSWGMVGVIVAFVFLYRIGQYLLFAWQTGCISFPLPTN
jgi:ATP-binding cassette subfamily G (WHITE) protein 2 (SNQ2)